MNVQAPAAPRLHPLVATAAVAVTTLSLVGIAAFTGMLPAGKAEAAPALAVAVPPAPTFTAPPAAEARPAPRPVKPAVKVVAPAPKVAPAAVSTRAGEPSPPPAPVRVATAPVATPMVEPPAPPPCLDCGVIDDVRTVAQPGEANGLGAVIGGVAGGLLGSQIGGGNGRKLAAVLGAAGGAYAGHQFEKSRNETTRHEIDVRLNDGTLRTLTQENITTWRVGDRIRIVNGVLVAAD